MERRRTGRVVYPEVELNENDNKEERRKKVAGELILASLEILENNVGDLKSNTPFKPSVIADTAFNIAPNGKFRGMKFKRNEILTVLKLLVVQGKVYSVPGKSGAHKYSSFPLGGSESSNNTKLVTVGSLRVPHQSIEWPEWPSDDAIAKDKLSRMVKAESDNTLVRTDTQENPSQEIENFEQKDENRRRGSREVRSRFMEVDGHVVLKANNYSLEEGESSVWGTEVMKVPLPPKKPLTAYMLFSRSYREKHFPPMDEDARKAKKRKLAAEPKTKGSPNGSSKAKTKAVAQMEQLVAAWKDLDDAKKAEFELKADELRKEYDDEVDEWRKATQEQLESQKDLKETRSSVGGVASSRSGVMNGNSSLSRTLSSSVNWNEEVLRVLEVAEPGGVHFGSIQEKLSEKGLHRRWFELRAPIRSCLRKGTARRILVNLNTDLEFFNALKERMPIQPQTTRPPALVATSMDVVATETTQPPALVATSMDVVATETTQPHALAALSMDVVATETTQPPALAAPSMDVVATETTLPPALVATSMDVVATETTLPPALVATSMDGVATETTQPPALAAPSMDVDTTEILNNEGDQANARPQINSSSIPDERMIASVKFEYELRRVVLNAVMNLSCRNQIDTASLVETTMEVADVALMTESLDSESVVTLPKIRAKLLGQVLTRQKSIVEEGDEGGDESLGDEETAIQASTNVTRFSLRPGWHLQPHGRRFVYVNEVTGQTCLSRDEMEKVIERQFKGVERVWLGGMNNEGIWEISSSALNHALAYIVAGLLKSKHLCATTHNNHEGYLPANLFVPGPAFPSAGRNKVDVVRKEHNDTLAAEHARNTVSSAKFVAAHLDVVHPFLDPKVASVLVKRMSVLKDSAAAASVELEEMDSATTLSGAATEISFRGKPTTIAMTEAAQQREELERRVDVASLPVMTYPSPLLQQPSLIEGTMRNYQLEGFSWLSHCYYHGVNCILADEMGLGKTLQTIAYLTHVSFGDIASPTSDNQGGGGGQKGHGGPHLVVVPLSVLTSWVLELRRFAPSLRVVRLHSGDEKERDRLRRDVLSDLSGYDVVVTTYDMLVSNSMKSCLTRQWWRCMVLDEGHKIKNEETDVSEACRRIRAIHRVLLTGTPMQNNLHELWAMLNFLLPQVFVSSTPFDKCFDLTRGMVDKDMLDKAHDLMKLFSLRRLKSEVEVSLPPKRELKILVPLSEFQLHFYRALLLKDVGLLKAAAAQAKEAGEDQQAIMTMEGGGGGGDGAEEEGSEWKRLQSLMMQLRKCCDHPYLFSGADPNPDAVEEGVVTSSNKMVLLDRLLPKLQAGGHRVLIFSQFTKMLDILADYCRLRKFAHARLDGSTNRVQRAIDVRLFNQDQSPLFIFLMSTRAGGLGINLQTADTVILYDSDWNPQVDLQAIGRAHRIGQTKPVHVYRLITEGAVEERIYDRAQKKLYLSEMVNRDMAGQAEDLDRLGKKELLNMLSFGADTVFKSSGRLPSATEIEAMIDRSEASSWLATDGVTESAFTSGAQETIDFDPASSLRKFQGIDYDPKTVPEHTRDIARIYHEKRERKSRFVQIGQDNVLIENNYEVTASSYVFDGNATKESVEKKSSKRQVAGRDYTHESTCLVCWDGGSVILCDRCPAAYHPACLGYSGKDMSALSSSVWSCPHHQCMECGRKAQAVGGLIFRCEVCPKAFCEDHLPIDADLIGHCSRFEDLGMRHPDQACFIHCSSDCRDWAKGHVNIEVPSKKKAKSSVSKDAKKAKTSKKQKGVQ